MPSPIVVSCRTPCLPDSFSQSLRLLDITSLVSPIYLLQRRLRGNDTEILEQLVVKRNYNASSQVCGYYVEACTKPEHESARKILSGRVREIQKLRTLSFENVTEVMDHVIAESTTEYKGTTHAHSFMFFHDGLRQMDDQALCPRDIGFRHRQLTDALTRLSPRTRGSWAATCRNYAALSTPMASRLRSC